MADYIDDQFDDDLERLEVPDVLPIAEYIGSRIVGEEQAVEKWAIIVNRILSNAPRLRDDRPLENILELGPSGVGKTEIVRVISKYLKSIGSSAERIPHIRINCGEFQEGHTISRVIGSAPGYVGHGTVKPLLDQSEIKRNAIRLPDGREITLVLIDEIEKAHSDLMQLLLGVMDCGNIQMGTNKTTDMRSTVLVFTSNLGNKEIQSQSALLKSESRSREGQIGFVISSDEQSGALKSDFSDIKKAEIRRHAARGFFTSEQISRFGGIDNVVVFNELSPEAIKTITLQKLGELEEVCKKSGIDVELYVSSSGLDVFLEKGYSVDYGVRPLESIINNEVGPRLQTLQSREEPTSVVIRRGKDGNLEVCVFKKKSAEGLQRIAQQTSEHVAEVLDHRSPNFSIVGRINVSDLEQDNPFIQNPEEAYDSIIKVIKEIEILHSISFRGNEGINKTALLMIKKKYLLVLKFLYFYVRMEAEKIRKEKGDAACTDYLMREGGELRRSYDKFIDSGHLDETVLKRVQGIISAFLSNDDRLFSLLKNKILQTYATEKNSLIEKPDFSSLKPEDEIPLRMDLDDVPFNAENIYILALIKKEYLDVIEIIVTGGTDPSDFKKRREALEDARIRGILENKVYRRFFKYRSNPELLERFSKVLCQMTQFLFYRINKQYESDVNLFGEERAIRNREGRITEVNRLYSNARKRKDLHKFYNKFVKETEEEIRS